MTTTTSVGQDELRAKLARRSQLDPESLWFPVHQVPHTFGLSWPLTGDQAEHVLTELLDELRQVLPAPVDDAGRPEPATTRRYVYLSEMTDRYQRCDTARILTRIHTAGVTPARPEFGDEEYDPRSECGWGARPSVAPDPQGDKPNWSWWHEVREVGPRPMYRMPDPYVGQDSPPVDRALDLRTDTGNTTAYRAALLATVREDPRQIDCWAHLGADAYHRADTNPSALPEALGFYQTAVAVAELSLPDGFAGVLAWGPTDNRPFHRALHGLGLTWWRLGETAKAAAAFENSLWLNPDDNQGVRYLIGQATAGAPWPG